MVRKKGRVSSGMSTWVARMEVRGATKTSAFAVAFSMNPIQTTVINPHPHTSNGHSQPIVSACLSTAPNRNSCTGIAWIKLSSTLQSLMHLMAVALAPCIMHPWPCPTTAALTHPWLPLLHALAMRSKMLSWSVLKSPNAPPF